MNRLALIASPALVLALVISGAAESPPAPERVPLAAAPPSSAFLGLLPDGEEKRRFILDCTGCHVFDERIAFPGGRARTREEWETAVHRMVGFAGTDSRFPVISADRDPARTAEWLAANLHAPPPERPAPASLPAGAEVREYEIPEPRDLPHDLVVDRDGQVVITGMMTSRMYRLDPATGQLAVVPIPHQGANPRAVDIDAEGRWWVLLGGPQKIAVHTPRTGEWAFHEIGMYPHSIGLAPDGRVWFNGHFTRDPEKIGYLDGRTGQVRTFDVPRHPTMADRGGPIPYDLQLAPDGRVWGSELQGNRIFGFDPRSGAFEVHPMPASWSGPRRMEFDARDALWIPEYANNSLTRFDPATKRFTRHELPIPDALPYVVRIDRQRNRVWIGTGAADAVVRFDPASERFTVYPLPSRGALVRHMAVDARTGDLWIAYGASPGPPAKVARLRVAE